MTVRLRPAPAWVAGALVGAGAVALAVAHLLTGPGSLPPAPRVIGERELVQVSANGEREGAAARIDTGAERSVIDVDLADELGLDLDDAPTVTVRSALGREQRPLADVTLTLAGRTFDSTVSVTDRSGLSAPVLVGRRDLDGFQVAVGSADSTGRPVSPLVAAVTRASTYPSVELLAALPIAAAGVAGVAAAAGAAAAVRRRPGDGVVAALVGGHLAGTRSVVALLLGVTAVQAGMLTLALAAAALLVALPAVVTARRAGAPGPAGLAVAALLSLAGLVLVELTDVDPSALTWPLAASVLAAALLASQLHAAAVSTGIGSAALAATVTVAAALVAAALLLLPWVQSLAVSAPLVLAGVGVLWTALAVSAAGRVGSASAAR